MDGRSLNARSACETPSGVGSHFSRNDRSNQRCKRL